MHFWSSGCYAYWCFPCFTCTTTGEFGESTCLPLLDILGPALMAAFGIGVCVPPVGLAMRVAVRYKYHIGVSFSSPSTNKRKRATKQLFICMLQQGSICEDIMTSCCCIWCSWCQMSREIKARKKVIRVVQRHPMMQPVPMAVNPQVVAMQQPTVIGGAPVGVGPAIQMAPI